MIVSAAGSMVADVATGDGVVTGIEPSIFQTTEAIVAGADAAAFSTNVVAR